MRKMTVRVLTTVIAALAACMLVILFLVMNVNTVARQYESNIRSAMQSQQLAAEICENIYQTESQVWQHIVNEEEEEYETYEERIDGLLVSMSTLLANLQDSLTDEEDKVLSHEVIRQYIGFKSSVQVVLELSRQGSKQSAQYYVQKELNPYFDAANELLNAVNAKTTENSRLAEQQMEASIYKARLEAILCMIVVGLIIIVCVFLVFRNGKRIVGQQEEEKRNHEQRVMALQYNIIVAMANLIESRDEDTGEHVKRTSWYVDTIARELAKDSPYKEQLTESYLDNLWKAAPLHDIGKIKVSDTILCKPGKLMPEEFETMKTHAAEGGKIVYETMHDIEEQDYVELAHDVAKYHHEKWNGSGYPEGLSGQDIPLCARIMAVADVFDALTSKRCYKEAMSVEEAYKIIEESSGTHFDPVVAEAFIRLRPKVEEFLRENRE
ncbi:MAG: HD domain-containing protein [Lachnospiraceae bacterium]|nr:HD domain-containing protein [Lachnospiraceae bacterium]